MQCLSPLCQSPDREAAVIVYQKNWHWHHYIWPRVFVHCCCSWHILVHARAHSLTLQCFKSERGCWQTAEHLVSKWSPWPPFSATVSAWNKPLLIWTGIMYSQSSVVSLALCSRDKNKYRNRGRCDIGALPEEWQQVGGGVATTSQICHLV